MTDEAHDAQTLATSARIERLHFLRFGSQRRTWTCALGHVNRNRLTNLCTEGHPALRPWNFTRPVENAPYFEPYEHYGKTDPEELIYSRAN